MTLAELIARLEAADPKQVVPHGFRNPHSYRGYYTDLAFEPATDITVGEMLTAARSALGQTFQGYKGGDFEMSEHTDCWLSEEGCASGDTISALLLDLMLAEPAGVAPATDESALIDRIRRVLARCDGFDFDSLEPHDYQIQAAALAAVLPACTGQTHPAAVRAAALREAADWLKAWRPELFERWAIAEQERYEGGVDDAADELRRMAAVPAAAEPADETQAVGPVQHAPGRAVLCPDCRAKGWAICMTADVTPCGPALSQCDAETGEPCTDHEREQAHAEGEHCFCGPECNQGCTCASAGEAFRPIGHYRDCPAATPEPHPTEADVDHALKVLAKFEGRDTTEPAAGRQTKQEN